MVNKIIDKWIQNLSRGQDLTGKKTSSVACKADSVRLLHTC